MGKLLPSIVTMMCIFMGQSAGQLNFGDIGGPGRGYGYGAYPYQPQRNYNVGYGYLSAGFGGRNALNPYQQQPQFGVAKVQVQKNPLGYQYSVQENGPYYQKYHHQTASSTPEVVNVPIPASPVGLAATGAIGLTAIDASYNQGYGFGHGTVAQAQLLPLHGNAQYPLTYGVPIQGGQFGQFGGGRGQLPLHGQGQPLGGIRGQGIPFQSQQGVGNIPYQEQALALHGQSLPLHGQTGVPTFPFNGGVGGGQLTYPYGRVGLSPSHYGGGLVGPGGGVGGGQLGQFGGGGQLGQFRGGGQLGQFRGVRGNY